MKIEEGKFYRSKGGSKVGPMKRYEQDQTYWIEKDLDGRGWTGVGEGVWASSGEDLISLWDDEASPIQSRIIKSVKSGQYGLIVVDVDQTTEERVSLSISHHQCKTTSASFGVSELRAAALTFTQLADFLEEQGK